MSNGQRGFTMFLTNVLREFHIQWPSNVTEGTRAFIRAKFRAGYSIDATVRDLRAELHAQLIANAAQSQAEADSLV
jgi:hypothetical protein